MSSEAMEDDSEKKIKSMNNCTVRLPYQIFLFAAVVVLGCANNISKQVAAKPLGRFTYLLGVADAIVYVPIYWSALACLLYTGTVPRVQMQWAWGKSLYYQPGLLAWLPNAAIFMASAFGDAIGNVLGFICTPYVSGPVHSLLAQFTTLFIALLSVTILRKMYSMAQCSALACIILAAILGILPNLAKQGADANNRSDQFFSILLAGSCAFNGLAFVLKDLAFRMYADWYADEHRPEKDMLSIFIVNSHESLFQLPFTLLAMPLAVATGQTNHEPLGSYIREGFDCVGGHSSECHYAGICIVVFVFVNVAWNLAILLSVRQSGALATFVALKLIVPLSAVLFAYVDWPLLHTTPLHWLTWVSLAVMLPSMAFFVWASREQDARAAKHPSLATCCWPLRKEKDMGDIE